MHQKAGSVSKWFTLLRVLLFYIGSVILFAFTSGLTKNIPAKIADHLSVFLAAVLTLLLVLIFTRWEKLRPGEVGLVPGRKSAARFFAGCIAGLSMAVAQALLVLGFGHFHLTFVSQITVADILSALLLFFLVAVREELVFRSYALRSLNYKLGAVLALIIITTIFIVEHIIAGMPWMMAVLGSGMGGLLFGLSALKTKGLALPLGLHCAWNFGQWSLGFKNKPGIWEAIVEKGYEEQVQNIGLIAFVFVMAMAIAGVCLVYRKEKLVSLSRKREECNSN